MTFSLLQDNSSKEKTMFDVVGEFDVFKRAQVRVARQPLPDHF
jgi:hypothetical protein